MAYSLEFRARAVEFVKDHPELTYAQAAAHVGVGLKTLVRWLKRAGFGRGRGPKVRDRPSLRMQKVFDFVDAGMSIHAAAEAVGMSPSNCYRMWARFRPMSPLQRGRRGGLALAPDVAGPDTPAPIRRGHGARLTFHDRAQIEYLLNSERLSARKIAQQMGVEPSTVSREINRNSRDGVYKARFAHKQATRRKTRPKVRKLDTNIRLRREVIRLITHTYSRRIPLHSPQHIAQRLRAIYPQDPSMHISHESIYQAIYVTGKGNLRDEIKLEKVLRSGRTARKPRSKLAGMTHTRKGRTWCQESLICLRDEDFPDAHTKLVHGHWEGDLIIGSDGKSALVTLVERTSRYVLIRRLPNNHETKTVTETIMDMVKELSMPQAWKSLTWDQGVEMAGYKQYFTMPEDFKVYFADPHSPWQRGCNENINRQIREYFPKGTDFNDVTDEDVRKVQIMLNDRARLVLNGFTPSEKLPEVLNVALTA